MHKNSRVLITGANGFTGKHAVLYFSGLGINVFPIFNTNNQKNGYICDLKDKTSVFRLIQSIQPDYILHLAGLNSVSESWKNPVEYMEVNLMGTCNLLEAVRKEVPHCKTIVVGSALQSELTNLSIPPHPYSLSKTLQALIADAWGELMETNVIVAKPSNLIGPGLSNGICSILGKKIIDIEMGKSKPIIEINDVREVRDFLDVRDVVSAYHLLLCKGKNGQHYEIGSGIRHSLSDVIKQYKDLTGLNFSVCETREINPSNPYDLNISKIKQLNWKPQIPLTRSLQDILNFFKQEGTLNNCILN
ncbi:UDP-2-acetamido-2,6-dideoxy-hexulose 4-reductase [Bacillus thuringiensis serovar yunnanensis]|nr:UDP-2-acetamido-2,6-dideoxy-hexulose 4-reductase [Bacillus thuringiensis serovar yunnanensis]